MRRRVNHGLLNPTHHVARASGVHRDVAGGGGVASEAWQATGTGLCLNQVTPNTHQCQSDVGISFWIYMTSVGANQFVYDVADNSSGQSIYALEYSPGDNAFKGYHMSDAGSVNYLFLVSSFPAAVVESGHPKTNTWFHLDIVHRYTPNCSVNSETPFSATSINNQNTPSTGANSDTVKYIGRADSGTYLASGSRISQMRICDGSTDIASFRATENWQNRINSVSETYLFEAYLLEEDATCELSEANWMDDLTLSTGSFTTSSAGPTLAA